MNTSTHDTAVLRDLVSRYAEITADDVQDRRRRRWRDLNSLSPVAPPIYVRGGNCLEEVPEINERRCQDRLLAGLERQVRYLLYWASLNDDSVFEPWLRIGAVHRTGGWGLEPRRIGPAEPGGAWKHIPPIQEPDDIRKLIMPRHEIDQAATAERAARARDAVGDILPIHVDRGPAWRMWSADLSTDLGHLRGIETFMLDMMDRPEWLHELMAFLRDGVLAAHKQAEDAGDWSLAEHQNQAMTYSRELPDPAPNSYGAKRSQLWGYAAAQEFTLVSPAMHEEFLLSYQRPILEKFGLVAYGCCEDLTRKIDMLRVLPNLRRIAVAPRADVARCAEQIGGDYVMSYRPNPAEMVCCGFDANRVRRIISRDLTACRGQCLDITLKDVNTVEHQPQRLAEWVRIVREVIAEVW
jgi:hypothetical protein